MTTTKSLAAILALTLANCSASNSKYTIADSLPLHQRTQRSISSLIDTLDQDTPLFSANANIATGLSNLTRATEDDLYGYQEVEFTLPEGTRVAGLYKQGKPDLPLLISSFGFIEDKKANAALNYIQIATGFPLHDYNLLLLDHPSSAPFYCMNGELGWGGIEEGYILTQVAQQMKEKYAFQSIHLVGISMGGTGVIHAAYRGKGIIDSALAFSPVTDMTQVPGNTLRHLNSESELGPHFWTLQEFINTQGFEMLWEGFKKVLRDPLCKERPKIHLDNLERALLDTNRYKDPERMKGFLQPYIDDTILPPRIPTTVSQYLALSDVNLIARAIKVPLLIVHAHDDPVVSEQHYYRFMLAAHGNSHVLGKIYSDGGHWGFSAAYGEKWVGCLIKTYTDYWSTPNFSVNPKCL